MTATAPAVTTRSSRATHVNVRTAKPARCAHHTKLALFKPWSTPSVARIKPRSIRRLYAACGKLPLRRGYFATAVHNPATGQLVAEQPLSIESITHCDPIGAYALAHGWVRMEIVERGGPYQDFPFPDFPFPAGFGFSPEYTEGFRAGWDGDECPFMNEESTVEEMEKRERGWGDGAIAAQLMFATETQAHAH